METGKEKVRSLWIPMRKMNLLLPNVAVAEVSAGEIVTVIIPAVAPDGYTGEIDLIVGVNSDGSVAGVRALSHRETPGLGDKIFKDQDFQENFEALLRLAAQHLKAHKKAWFL